MCPIARDITNKLSFWRLGGKMAKMGNLLRRCHECGQPLGKKEIFCPKCGTKQRRNRRVMK
jgi:uncharacterized Zn finger protein (UPF0148 family)